MRLACFKISKSTDIRVIALKRLKTSNTSVNALFTKTASIFPLRQRVLIHCIITKLVHCKMN